MTTLKVTGLILLFYIVFCFVWGFVVSKYLSYKEKNGAYYGSGGIGLILLPAFFPIITISFIASNGAKLIIYLCDGAETDKNKLINSKPNDKSIS